MDWGPITVSFVIASAAVLFLNALCRDDTDACLHPAFMAWWMFAAQIGVAFWTAELKPPESLYLGPVLDTICGLAAGLFWRANRARWSFALAVVFLMSGATHVVFFAQHDPGRTAYWVYGLVLNVLSAVQLLILASPGISNGLGHLRSLLRRPRMGPMAVVEAAPARQPWPDRLQRD